MVLMREIPALIQVHTGCGNAGHPGNAGAVKEIVRIGLPEWMEQPPENIKPYSDFLEEHGWIQQYETFMPTYPAANRRG